MKTWFITGVSRGLGKALAEAALWRGDTVVGTTRTGQADIAHGQGKLHVLSLEMTDAAAISRTVAQAFDLVGRIDVLVNNAGYGLLGAFEDASDDDAQHLFAVDVFGPIRVIQAALPRLRAQKAGHIITVTSIAGRAPGAGSALYAAAKSALEGLSASLAQELAPLGLHVTTVAPGAFRTDFLSDHSIRTSAPTSDAYAETAGKMLQAFNGMAGKQAGDPERAADAILALADATNPPQQLLLGTDALRRFRGRLDAMTAEIQSWEAVTIGTDYAV